MNPRNNTRISPSRGGVAHQGPNRCHLTQLADEEKGDYGSPWPADTVLMYGHSVHSGTWGSSQFDKGGPTGSHEPPAPTNRDRGDQTSHARPHHHAKVAAIRSHHIKPLELFITSTHRSHSSHHLLCTVHNTNTAANQGKVAAGTMRRSPACAAKPVIYQVLMWVFQELSQPASHSTLRAQWSPQCGWLLSCGGRREWLMERGEEGCGGGRWIERRIVKVDSRRKMRDGGEES